MGGRSTKEQQREQKKKIILSDGGGVPTENLLTELRKANQFYNEKTITVINNKGGQGIVVKVKCKLDNQSYAMKNFNYNFLDPNIDRAKKEEVFREIDNLRQLEHPNIVNIQDLVLQNNAPVVVMELCNGSLQDYIDKHKGQ